MSFSDDESVMDRNLLAQGAKFCIFCRRPGGLLVSWEEWHGHRGCIDQHEYESYESHRDG